MKNATMMPRLTKFMFVVGFLLTTIMSYANNLAYAQNQTFTFHLKNVSIKTVLQTIEKQSEFIFMYRSDLLDTSKKVSVDADKKSVSQILDQILEGTAVTYEINDRQIVLKKAEKPIAAPQQSSAKTISGLVTDGDGNPVIGATVKVKDTTTGVITDIDGRYSIKANIGQILVFSYIGFNTEERTIKSETSINVRMMEASVGLEDVVIIGYGQQKKESVVSSLNTIGPAELNVKQRNLRNTLAGQIAGVIAVQRSGEPGNDAAAFYIRGQSSYAGGTNPLVLVDGVPRSMDDIDVDEIESFTVLKDAAATAVYGAEGANGVVLITSKRGKVQKTQVNVSAQYSIVTPTRMPQTLNAYDYLSLYNEAIWNDKGNPTLEGYTPYYSQEVLDKYRTGVDVDLYPSVNWYDLLQEHTQSQRYTINFRGGSDKVRFFASGAYYSEDGIFKSNPTEKYNANIGLQRFNLRSNVDMDLTKTTQLSIDMSGQYLRKNQPGFSSDQIFDCISHFPVHVIPMYYSDGSASDHGSPGYGTDDQPYNMLNNSGYSKTWSAFLQTKVTLRQKLDFITQGLSVKGSVSFDADFFSTMMRNKTPETYYALGRNDDGTLNKK